MVTVFLLWFFTIIYSDLTYCCNSLRKVCCVNYVLCSDLTCCDGLS